MYSASSALQGRLRAHREAGSQDEPLFFFVLQSHATVGFWIQDPCWHPCRIGPAKVRRGSKLAGWQRFVALHAVGPTPRHGSNGLNSEAGRGESPVVGIIRSAAYGYVRSAVYVSMSLGADLIVTS